MRVSADKIGTLLKHWYRSRLVVVVQSVVIGAVAGLVVTLFRLALSYADRYRQWFYTGLRGMPPWVLPAWVAALVLAGLFLGWAAKAHPLIRGSGIPQVKGALTREMAMNWKPELPLKLITGLVGLGAGLSMGREGPSILIAAYTGLGMLTLLRRPWHDRKVLVTAASAAGLSAAFSAPLAGVLFALEELGSVYTPLFIACAMGASAAADAVAGIFFGRRPVFDFKMIDPLPLRYFPWVIVLGILCALLGDLFKRSLYGATDLYAKLKIPPLLRPVLPLLTSVPVCLFLPAISGGGHSLIESLSPTEYTLGVTALLLAGKIIFTAFCYGSGTSGGIFLPVLACGALAGSGLALGLSSLGFLPPERQISFVIFGMAGFFGAVAKAPVTGTVLILEMSGNFDHLDALVLVSFSAFVASEAIRSRPVYAVLLERLIAAKGIRSQSPPRPQY